MARGVIAVAAAVSDLGGISPTAVLHRSSFILDCHWKSQPSFLPEFDFYDVGAMAVSMGTAHLARHVTATIDGARPDLRYCDPTFTPGVVVFECALRGRASCPSGSLDALLVDSLAEDAALAVGGLAEARTSAPLCFSGHPSRIPRTTAQMWRRRI